MAQTSKVDIAQQAMVLVGLRPLTSFDDKTDEALSANLLYESVIKDCLTQHPWNFATGQKTLNRLADTPIDTWDAAYQLPTDVEPLIIQTITVTDNPISYDTTNLAENMIWEERISKWFGGWKNVFNLKAGRETDSLKKIKKFKVIFKFKIIIIFLKIYNLLK